MDARCVGCKGFPNCDPDDCDILKHRVRLSDGDDDDSGFTPAPATPTAYPDDNPKTVIGLTKPSMSAVPPSCLLHLGRAMSDGKRKYGLMNWREKKVSTSVYYDAAMRHLMAFWDGEDCAEDSGVHHLGHVMACCALILDAASIGKLNDDRPIPGNYPALVKAFTKPMQEARQ